ncbi:MAG: hypothetical protein QOJ89_1780 [bacterium]|jgi:uncharacterized protein YukJ
MPLKNYGVLRARAIDHQLASRGSEHFQIHALDGDVHHRIAINVASKEQPSVLDYLMDSDFRHPILETLAALPAGFSPLEPKPGGAALDFIRGNLFDRDALRQLPFDVPGPDNDLNEKLAVYVRRAIADPGATLLAFGERWGPEPGVADKYFGFEPGNGVHDIHMNQSNVGRFAGDNGVYQDGALLLHFPEPQQWVAIFLKFQSQGWHTDDASGRPLGGEPDGIVRIVAALVNALESPETEFVTLLNTTAAAVDLDGWTIADRDGRTMTLEGAIGPGETLRVQLAAPVALPNGGGVINLLDAAGLKVDGVFYTGEQAAEAGRTIVL